MIDDTMLEAEEKMEKAVEVAKEDFANIRTGRAHPGMFQKLLVDYYGAPTPLKQLATIHAAEARLLTVQPYDKNSIKAIERAIMESDIGLTPSNDGQIIRVVVPQMTEERRKEMAKLAKQKGEEGKITVRNIRRKVKEEIDRFVKDGEVGEDEGARAEKELDSLTHRYVGQIDELVKNKEAELLEV